MDFGPYRMIIMTLCVYGFRFSAVLDGKFTSHIIKINTKLYSQNLKQKTYVEDSVTLNHKHYAKMQTEFTSLWTGSSGTVI